MAELTVSALRKRFGNVEALAGAELTVLSGHLTAVLGPSGCGKTTLLRCVAGFEIADAGRILLNGRDITRLAPQRRRIAVVPQEGALFPHLSVAANVAYGLDRAGRRGNRVPEVLELVGLAGLGNRMPHQLSGGQQQRVAVARALAPRPPVVLLDEPFSALDAALRVELRRDVRDALRADGATGILVTHDQGEALSIADSLAVMRDGIMVQCGSPDDVYAVPASPWVADFIGEAVWLAAGHPLLSGVCVLGGGQQILVRPEQISVIAGNDAQVVRRNFHGHDAILGLELAGAGQITVRVLGPHIPALGDRVSLNIEGAARAYP